MECLQYLEAQYTKYAKGLVSFKPCYKWNAFNTQV